MHKSISNLIIIRKKQVGELKDYKKREEKTIKQRKEALAKESIRIAEDQKSYAGEKLEVDNLLKEIEDKVYADTKEQHEEKYKLDEMIDDLNKDIEELMRVLDRKRKEKEMLELEKQVHERKIDQARMGYRGEIEQSQEQLDRVTARIGHTELALATFDKDTKDLEEL
jgi:chromosome segregation ATPase